MQYSRFSRHVQVSDAYQTFHGAVLESELQEAREQRANDRRTKLFIVIGAALGLLIALPIIFHGF